LLDGIIQRQIQEKKPIRLIILKARRVGISTFLEGDIFHYTTLNPGVQSYIAAADSEQAKSLFDMSKLFYEQLSPEVKPMRRYCNEKALFFENPKEKQRAENPGLRSGIKIGTAGKIEVARGQLIHRLHCCLHPDTLIDVEINGNRTYVRIKDMSPGYTVFTFEGKKVEVKGISKIGIREIKEKMICIRTVTKNLYVTSNHKVFTQRGWVEAGKLKSGKDYLVGNMREFIDFDKIKSEPNGSEAIAITIQNLQLSDREARFTVFKKNKKFMGILLDLLSKYNFDVDENSDSTSLIVHSEDSSFIKLLKEYYNDFAMLKERSLSLSEAEEVLSYLCSADVHERESGKIKRITKERYAHFRDLIREKIPNNRQNNRSSPGINSLERKFCAEKYSFSQVISVKEEPYRGFVYDLILDDKSHCFQTSEGIVHNSELSDWRGGSLTLDAILHCVPDLPNTAVYFESTAKGIGNMFHDEWQRAILKDSDFVPIFFPFFIDPDNKIKCGKGMIEEIKDTLDDEEKELIMRFNLGWDQLAWRRNNIKNKCHGDIDIFHQENPSTHREAFVTTTFNVFKAEVIRSCFAVKEPIFYGHLIEEDGCVTLREGGHKSPVRVWKFPEKGHTYVVGADPTVGIDPKTGDPAAMQVLDIKTLEQVAEYEQVVDADVFENEMIRLGFFYNAALVNLELSGPGWGIIRSFKDRYPNIVYWPYLDDPKKRNTGHLGWETTCKTKEVMRKETIEHMRSGALTLRSNWLLHECDTYCYNEYMHPEAKGDAHDDLVLALELAVVALNNVSACAPIVEGPIH
jgi:intein/homing endonuclease